MKKLLPILLLSVFVRIPLAYSTNYYFSNTGSDALNTGITQDSPFKTIAKLNTLSLKEGDQVFFKRGEIFEGQINILTSGTSSQNITIDAYGTGNAPVITGVVQVINWRVHSGNVFVADVPDFNEVVTQLFVNQSLMTLARYPNSGYIIIDSSSGKLTLSSDLLTQPDGYWNGANVISRTERWVFENKIAANYTVGTLELASPTEFNLKNGFGFFLNNKFSELDTPGEWFHDVQAKKIYLIPPSQGDVNNLKIEAAIYNYGININRQNYISIKNLSIGCQRLDGIYIFGCSNISISSNNFFNAYRNGIWTGYGDGTNIRVHNNVLENIGKCGVCINRATSSIIKGNILKKIALNPEISGSASGIQAGPESYVANNILDSIGYNGIGCTSGDTIAYNYIKNTCLLRDDGGGIYTYKSKGLMINNNIIINSIGNGEASDKENFTSAHGIYLDDSTSYCSLLNNTVVNTDYGIFVHNSFNNILKGNILYNNRKTQLRLQGDHMVTESVDVKENIISGNVFYSLNPDQLCIYFWTRKNDVTNFGTFDKNYYCNPYSKILIKTFTAPYYPLGTLQKTQTYNFESWKKLFVMDINSQSSKVNFAPYYNIQSISENLISNSTFNNNKNYWYKWGSPNYSIKVDTTNALMSLGSLKSEFTDFTLNTKGYYAHGDFPVVEGDYFKLSFKANSVKTSSLDFDVTKNAFPFTPLELNNSFLIEQDSNHFDFVFKTNSSLSNARVLFSTTVYDSTLWMDDVSLLRVSVDTNTSKPCTNSPILINPTSATKTIRLPGSFKDLNGYTIRRFITLPPFSSKIYTSAILVGSFRTSNGDILSPTPISDISISPVPSQVGDKIYIQYPDGTKDIMADYSILDLSGKEISKGSVTFDDSNRLEISTVNFSKGFSIIKLTTETNIKTAKIILF